jgi:hypothetical protein
VWEQDNLVRELLKKEKVGGTHPISDILSEAGLPTNSSPPRPDTVRDDPYLSIRLQLLDRLGPTVPDSVRRRVQAMDYYELDQANKHMRALRGSGLLIECDRFETMLALMPYEAILEILPKPSSGSIRWQELKSWVYLNPLKVSDETVTRLLQEEVLNYDNFFSMKAAP